MIEHNLFGVFLKERRLEKDLSLRQLACKVNIAHTYLRSIENGKKSPPSDEILFKLSDTLQLDEKSRLLFFDIAAKAKELKDSRNISVPADILKYLDKTNSAKNAIREADKLGYSNEFWDTLIKQIK